MEEISRRHFLQAAGAVAGGLLATRCQKTIGVAPQAQVGIARAAEYDRKLIEKTVRDLLDRVGGLGDVIRSGDRVAIKTNLAGGVKHKPLPGVSAVESYVTHPEIVRALGGLVRDAGAKEIFIVEAVYEWDSYPVWGYEEIAKDIDATLVDLNGIYTYKDFAHTPVGEGWLIYRDFRFNPILENVDAFISVPKMKCHWGCGVTLSMKNLVGLVPSIFYRLKDRDRSRSAMHGVGDEFSHRLPRVIMDLNRARPVDFALVDGIRTSEGGEGPWLPSMAAVDAGVLIAGKNPVATDAVASAVMGFDPTAEKSKAPFLRAENHLNLAREIGLGTNRLDEIEVVGPSIGEVSKKFEPCWT
jgi:uncharacterized protein (DUF362 family)